MLAEPATAHQPASGGVRGWRHLLPRLAVALATGLWLLAWGRLGYVAVAQPSTWQESAWTLADERTAANPRGYRCRLNAFQRDDLVYRWCDGHEGRTYLVVFAPTRRAVTVRWELPSTLFGPDWFEGFAVGPAGELALLSNREGGVAILHPDGTAEVLPPISLSGDTYGFGWAGGQLGVVSADSAAPVVAARLSVYRAGQGWSAPQPLPVPDCGVGSSCALLVAAPAPEGWEQHYARAPRHPADPARIDAEILRVSPSGETRVVQTLPFATDVRTYSIENGELRWYGHLADRSGGNVLNYSGNPALRQLVDGTFQPLPNLPLDLFLRPDERGAPLNPIRLPRGSNLTASYRVAAGRLVWQPTYSRAGDAGATERATLLDDRWLVLRETAAGIALEERATDGLATVLRDGPLILGRQGAALDLGAYTTPLLRATDGSYWLIGRFGDLVHAGPDLRRLDQHSPLARFGLLFGGFGGFYADDLHAEHPWLKPAALAFALFAWPLCAALLALWRRAARPDREAWWGRAGRVGAACAVVAILCAPWFWLATAYF